MATAGTPLADARAVLILLHGRGASAAGILTLGSELGLDGVAYLAPQAAGASWYPRSFLAPAADNEPWLTSALGAVRALVDRVGAPERTVLAGFSQGACLALEFAARNARRYGGVIGLSGGLIGPPGTPREYGGTFGGTPCFLGCSDIDPHIPVQRVEETAAVLEAMGGDVTSRIYPGMPRTVNEDELQRVAELVRSVG